MNMNIGTHLIEARRLAYTLIGKSHDESVAISHAMLDALDRQAESGESVDNPNAPLAAAAMRQLCFLVSLEKQENVDRWLVSACFSALYAEESSPGFTDPHHDLIVAGVEWFTENKPALAHKAEFFAKTMASFAAETEDPRADLATTKH